MKAKDLFSLSVLAMVFAGCASLNFTDPNLIFHCTFDSAEAIQQPEIGPVAFVSSGMEFVDGIDGKALMIPAHKRMARYTLPAGFLGGKGTISFFAKIETDNTMFANCSPIFFDIRFDNGEQSTIQFSANNGLGRGGLYGRLVHHERVSGGCRAMAPYSEILGEDIRRWHRYSFIWNINGVTGYKKSDGSTSQAVLVVDGNVLADSPFMDHGDPEKTLMNVLAHSAELSFPENNGSNVPFSIDDFKIWNIDKAELLK